MQHNNQYYLSVCWQTKTKKGQLRIMQMHVLKITTKSNLKSWKNCHFLQVENTTWVFILCPYHAQCILLEITVDHLCQTYNTLMKNNGQINDKLCRTHAIVCHKSIHYFNLLTMVLLYMQYLFIMKKKEKCTFRKKMN